MIANACVAHCFALAIGNWLGGFNQTNRITHCTSVFICFPCFFLQPDREKAQVPNPVPSTALILLLHCRRQVLAPSFRGVDRGLFGSQRMKPEDPPPHSWGFQPTKGHYERSKEHRY